MTVWIIFLIIDFFNHYLPDFWCLNRLSLLRKNYSFVKMKNNMVSSCDHLLSKMQYFNEWWDVFQIIHKELLYVFISTLCMLSNLCKGYLLTGVGDMSLRGLSGADVSSYERTVAFCTFSLDHDLSLYEIQKSTRMQCKWMWIHLVPFHFGSWSL